MKEQHADDLVRVTSDLHDEQVARVNQDKHLTELRAEVDIAQYS